MRVSSAGPRPAECLCSLCSQACSCERQTGADTASKQPAFKKQTQSHYLLCTNSLQSCNRLAVACSSFKLAREKFRKVGGGLRYRVTETLRTGQGFYLSVILLPFLIDLTCLSLYFAKYSVWLSVVFFYISAELCHPIFLTVLLCFFDCLSVFRRKFSCSSWSWRKWRRRGMSWGSIVTDWKARLVLKFNTFLIKLRLTSNSVQNQI